MSYKDSKMGGRSASYSGSVKRPRQKWYVLSLDRDADQLEFDSKTEAKNHIMGHSDAGHLKESRHKSGDEYFQFYHQESTGKTYYLVPELAQKEWGDLMKKAYNPSRAPNKPSIKYKETNEPTIKDKWRYFWETRMAGETIYPEETWFKNLHHKFGLISGQNFVHVYETLKKEATPSQLVYFEHQVVRYMPSRWWESSGIKRDIFQVGDVFNSKFSYDKWFITEYVPSSYNPETNKITPAEYLFEKFKPIGSGPAQPQRVRLPQTEALHTMLPLGYQEESTPPTYEEEKLPTQAEHETETKEDKLEQEKKASKLNDEINELQQELDDLNEKKDELEEKMSNRDDGGTEKQQERLEELESEISEIEDKISELEGEEEESTPSEKQPKLFSLQYDEHAGYPRFRGYRKPFDPSIPAMQQEWDTWDEDAHPLTEEQKSLARMIYRNELRISRIKKNSDMSSDKKERLIKKIQEETQNYSKKLEDSMK